MNVGTGVVNGITYCGIEYEVDTSYNKVTVTQNTIFVLKHFSYRMITSVRS